MIPRKKGTAFLLLGICLWLGALSLTLYNYWEADNAEQASRLLVVELEEQIAVQDDKTALQWAESEEAVQAQEMPVIEIDGTDYIGVLEIPSLGLSLPVAAEWDYTRLKNSPCRYTGSYYTDDLVICGHNYAKHFSPIRRVSIGSDVYFTNVNGEVIHYVVVNRETVQPTAVEEMIDNTIAGWDLTLFTCNLGGQTRCAVRCERSK
jgi:sortase A